MPTGQSKKFILPVSQPFRLDLTAWALRRRSKNRVDRWDGNQYSRVLVVGDTAVRVLVTQRAATELTVALESEANSAAVQEEVRALLQRMLSGDANLAPFYQLAEKDVHLQSLAHMFKGVKPPRFPSVFEALTNSVACQQVSLDAGIALLNKLAEKYGLKHGEGEEAQSAFPRPEDIYGISAEEIKRLGFSNQKARAITELAANLVEEKLPLSHLDAASNEEIFNSLMQIRGIGRWSAEYALLRGFGRLDVLPGDDVGAQKNLMQLLQLESRPTYEQIKTLSQRWQPYSGFVYFHLLLEKLQLKGLL